MKGKISIKEEVRKVAKSDFLKKFLPNFLNEKIKSGILTAIITEPIGILKRWLSIVPIPDTPPGAILFGEVNIAMPKENMKAPMAITR